MAREIRRELWRHAWASVRRGGRETKLKKNRGWDLARVYPIHELQASLFSAVERHAYGEQHRADLHLLTIEKKASRERRFAQNTALSPLPKAGCISDVLRINLAEITHTDIVLLNLYRVQGRIQQQTPKTLEGPRSNIIQGHDRPATSCRGYLSDRSAQTPSMLLRRKTFGCRTAGAQSPSHPPRCIYEAKPQRQIKLRVVAQSKVLTSMRLITRTTFV